MQILSVFTERKEYNETKDSRLSMAFYMLVHIAEKRKVSSYEPDVT
jgi:hypothetical protein